MPRKSKDAEQSFVNNFMGLYSRYRAKENRRGSMDWRYINDLDRKDKIEQTLRDSYDNDPAQLLATPRDD